MDFELDNVPDLEVAPDGEYKLTIASAEARTDKNGNPGVMLRFRVGRPNTKQCGRWISLPGEADNEEDRNNKIRRLKAFRDAFHLGFTTSSQFISMCDDKSLLGKEAYAVLVVKEDAEYGDSNEIKRFVVPKA
jgi:hypothetical protein